MIMKTVLSGTGFAEGQTFELGTVDVPATKRVKLVVSGGVLKAQVTSTGLVIFVR